MSTAFKSFASKVWEIFLYRFVFEMSAFYVISIVSAQIMSQLRFRFRVGIPYFYCFSITLCGKWARNLPFWLTSFYWGVFKHVATTHYKSACWPLTKVLGNHNLISLRFYGRRCCSRTRLFLELWLGTYSGLPIFIAQNFFLLKASPYSKLSTA
jgi:hypothetical protein